MAPLKLGKLPDRETTKVTFIANAELNLLLENYAAAYEREYGQREVITDLIPHMLEAFMKADRGFRMKHMGANPAAKTITQTKQSDIQD